MSAKSSDEIARDIAPPRSWQTTTDEELLRAITSGDTAAFDEFFTRHSAPVLAFLSRVVTFHCDPEDLLQETFLRVLTHAKDFRSGASLRPWLFTIARHIAINTLKKNKLRSNLEAPTDLADWKFSAQDNSLNPHNLLEQKERKARLLAALQALPPLHREIIVLIIFDGFSYEEAAAITGDPASTLRSRVFHALRKLREYLKEPC